MSEPFIENTDINPNELQDILVGFLGQTYGEISRYDSHIVAPNQFLAPKKYEFQKTAERVLNEVAPIQQNRSQHNHNPQRHYVQTQQKPQPNSQINTDPNQLEFSFDNSITAKTINDKLEELEKRIKKLDKTLESMISLLTKYEIKDTQ